MNIKKELLELKELINKKERIWYLRLIGVILCSLLTGLSIFHMVYDFSHWYIYSAFIFFGAIYIYLFNRKLQNHEKEIVKRKLSLSRQHARKFL